MAAIKRSESLCSRGGGISYKSDGDAHRKIQIYPLTEINVGVAQA